MVNVLCYFNGANIRKIYYTAKSKQKNGRRKTFAVRFSIRIIKELLLKTPPIQSYLAICFLKCDVEVVDAFGKCGCYFGGYSLVLLYAAGGFYEYLADFCAGGRIEAERDFNAASRSRSDGE